MNEELYGSLGISKTEAKIYETLIGYEELSVTDIAVFSKIDRRNAYDAIRRLMEKGLAFEIKENKESKYQVVHPKKLKEILSERQESLDSILPRMEKMYLNTLRKEAMFIYRGIDGWKNYMRDVLRTKSDLYSLGAKGGWDDQRLVPYVEKFTQEARKLGIKIKIIYDHDAEQNTKIIRNLLGGEYRYLPKEYKSDVTVDVYGDNVVILSNIEYGHIDDKSSLIVIKNKSVAEGFKQWFKFMWVSSNSVPKTKKE